MSGKSFTASVMQAEKPCEKAQREVDNQKLSTLCKINNTSPGCTGEIERIKAANPSCTLTGGKRKGSKKSSKKGSKKTQRGGKKSSKKGSKKAQRGGVLPTTQAECNSVPATPNADQKIEINNKFKGHAWDKVVEACAVINQAAKAATGAVSEAYKQSVVDGASAVCKGKITGQGKPLTFENVLASCPPQKGGKKSSKKSSKKGSKKAQRGGKKSSKKSSKKGSKRH
jgi:hypothetical protein